MKIGDKVHLSGTVRDIVEESVLIVTKDAPEQREYWIKAVHLEEDAAAEPTTPENPTGTVETAAPAEDDEEAPHKKRHR